VILHGQHGTVIEDMAGGLNVSADTVFVIGKSHSVDVRVTGHVQCAVG